MRLTYDQYLQSMPAYLQLVVTDPPFAQVAAMPTDPGSTSRTCSVEHGVGTFVATRGPTTTR